MRLLARATLFFVLSLPAPVFSQTDSSSTRTETVRGAVTSAESHLPLPHARITIQDTKRGAISSVSGEYRIVDVPVGHYIVKATANGYSPMTQEVLVSSAHQSVLNFELKETVVHGDTITVNGSNALEAINRVAAVSVTPFSIQDVNRYAAAFQDPSRMAENFAGVLEGARRIIILLCAEVHRSNFSGGLMELTFQIQIISARTDLRVGLSAQLILRCLVIAIFSQALFQPNMAQSFLQCSIFIRAMAITKRSKGQQR
jgi:hypothetical protein